jgi:hypothetical protein
LKKPLFPPLRATATRERFARTNVRKLNGSKNSPFTLQQKKVGAR